MRGKENNLLLPSLVPSPVAPHVKTGCSSLREGTTTLTASTGGEFVSLGCCVGFASQKMFKTLLVTAESNGNCWNMINLIPKLTYKFGPLRGCHFLTPGSKGSLGVDLENSRENPG